MTKQELEQCVRETFTRSPGNVIARDEAISPDLEGLVLFDVPLVGVASAHDDLFVSFRDDDIVGAQYMLPSEWLPGAESVVSMFFPFTERVRVAERRAGSETSGAWLHGRIEGQNFINEFTRRLCESLGAMGVRACAPSIDERFGIVPGRFTSNWSERHAAFVAGLGTFGLSRGLITSRGMAGRLSSVIIDSVLEPDTRTYERHEQFCIMCGVCARRCPAGAITLEGGKDNRLCLERLNVTRKLYAPRYGCGKCQTAVPCEFRNPQKNRPCS